MCSYSGPHLKTFLQLFIAVGVATTCYLGKRVATYNCIIVVNETIKGYFGIVLCSKVYSGFITV